MKKLLLIAILLIGSTAAEATEIRFLPEYRAEEPIVRLGQIAQVYSLDAEEAARLNALELFPAPGPARQRTVRLADVQEILRLHSFDVTKMQFSGAASIRVLGGQPVVASSGGEAVSNPAVIQQRQRRVQQAVEQYLARETADGQTWEAQVELSAAEAGEIPATGELFVVAREAEWVEGANPFWLFWRETGTGKTSRTEIAVYLRPAEMVVVPVRPIRRGEVLQAADLQQIPVEGQIIAGETLAKLEDVVGRQAARALAANRAIQRHDLQRPILVNRRDVVSVLARTGGLEVRTTAQAIDEGAYGDLITVESLTGHKRYLARVIDTQMVELFAGGVTAGDVRP